MIVNADELMIMPEFENVDRTVIVRKLKAIENMVRSYTNNTFQNRTKRFNAASSNSILCDCSADYFKIGDTVQITDSINNGLYVITHIDPANHTITLDGELYDSDNNTVTKVEYPDAIIDGAINLMLWEVHNRDKVGIQSETLSRHSVTYFAQDANNQLNGYPVALVSFLKPFTKARF